MVLANQRTSVMKSTLKATVLALSAIGAIAWATLSPAQVSPEYRNSKIIILEGQKGDKGYWNTASWIVSGEKSLRPISQQRVAVREFMMKRRVLEEYAEFLSPLELPRQLRLFASDCEGKEWDSPYYLGQMQWIDMCYSFIDAAQKDIDDLIKNYSREKWWTPSTREQLVAGMLVGVLLHETGHALFHLLDVPMFGRQEDAADLLAGYIPLQFDKETARTAIKGFVYLWQYLAMAQKANPPTTGKPSGNCPDPACAYQDVHGTASQRMYNVTCIAYGGDPATFQDLFDAGLLTPERAKNCRHEYETVKHAFAKSILPFINKAQMEKVRARKWFQPHEVKER
jgi:hypothetical protein